MLWIYLIASFLCTVLVSKALLKYVPAHLFADVPDGDRKVHQEIKPRFGGVAFATVIAAMLLFVYPIQDGYLWLFITYSVMLGIGLLDDLRGLSWKIKLAAQLLLGLYICYSTIQEIPVFQFFVTNFSLPIAAVYALFIFWMVGIMNAVNLIDGLDGLAGSLVVLISIGLIYLGITNQNSTFVLYAVIVASSLYGFLAYNSRPAKFFMGDTGSLFLGLNLAIAPILFFVPVSSNTVIDMTPFLLLYSFLIIDTFRVFYRRIRLGRNPMKPDNLHFHHTVLDLTKSYNTTLLVIFLLQALWMVALFGIIKLEYSVWSMMGYLLFGSYLILVEFPITYLLKILQEMVKYGRRGLRIINPKFGWLSTKSIPVLFFCYILINAVHLYSSAGSMLLSLFLLIILGLKMMSTRYFQQSSLLPVIGTGTYFLMVLLNIDLNLSIFSWFILSKMALFLLGILVLVQGLSRHTAVFSLRHWRNDDILFLVMTVLATGLLIINFSWWGVLGLIDCVFFFLIFRILLVQKKMTDKLKQSSNQKTLYSNNKSKYCRSLPKNRGLSLDQKSL